MRIVGVPRDDNAVDVANLSEDGCSLTILAGLDKFWADPAACFVAAPSGRTVPAESAHLVPPVLPGARVVCIRLNYLLHVAEGSYRDEPLPECPTLFARWPASLTVDAEVPVPPDEAGLGREGEIVAWIGKPLINAAPDEALAAVVGCSTFDDLAARRALELTSQWTLGKDADRSGPLGPMSPASQVGDLRDGLQVRARHNGTTVQEGSTKEMVYKSKWTNSAFFATRSSARRTANWTPQSQPV